MSEVPDESAAEKPLEPSGESRPVAEEPRRHSPVDHHADNFSLSALFLLMVTVAAILGFLSNVFRSAGDGQAYASKNDPLTMLGFVVLVLIGIGEGARAGFLLRRRFSTMVVGSFYGMIAAAIPIAALIHPPSLLMVCFSCGMLIAIGLLLKSKEKRTMVIDEQEPS